MQDKIELTQLTWEMITDHNISLFILCSCIGFRNYEIDLFDVEFSSFFIFFLPKLQDSFITSDDFPLLATDIPRFCIFVLRDWEILSLDPWFSETIFEKQNLGQNLGLLGSSIVKPLTTSLKSKRSKKSNFLFRDRLRAKTRISGTFF